jgi:hypothetical protein
MRWAGNITAIGEMRGVYRVLAGKPEGKRTLGRNRRRRENNINIHMDWIHLAQNRDR